MPRVFINSVPKAGTNLVSRAFDISGCKSGGLGIAPTLLLGNRYLARQLLRRSFFERSPVTVGLDIQVPIRRSWLSARLERVPDRHYVTGHANYSEALFGIMQEKDFRILQVIRDPLDVLVSYCHYIGQTPGHFLHEAYRGRPLDDQVDLALSGGRIAGLDISPFPISLDRATPWLKRPGVLTVRFEDFVGPKAGGSSEARLKTIEAMQEFTGFPLNSERIEEELYGASKTFRRGQIGSWREELSPGTADRAAAALGEVRARWNYA